jgi:hypothetical protein
LSFPLFCIEGRVGKVILTPHERYVGEVVALELHAPVNPILKKLKPKLLDPWVILFKTSTLIQGIKVGMTIKVSGALERCTPDTDDSPQKYRAHLKPMMHYFWGEEWSEIKNS